MAENFFYSMNWPAGIQPRAIDLIGLATAMILVTLGIIAIFVVRHSIRAVFDPLEFMSTGHQAMMCQIVENCNDNNY